jgi:hypothetical protein
MESKMSKHSSMHVYLNWAKERIDEMDAVLASLEAKTGQVKADSKSKANQLFAELKRLRDEFQLIIRKQTDAGEAAWEHMRPQLESQWKGFEARVQDYIDTVGKEFEQRQATFRDVADAQVKAWRDAADQFQDAAKKLATDRRANIDAAIKKMQADASLAETKMRKLQQAGGESWTVLNAALAESRTAFDRANKATWDALRRASS